MSIQSFQELAYSAVDNAVQISNTVTETIMIPDTPIPARFWFAGRTVKITLKGALSNVITTPGTLTFRARLNGVAGTVLVASAALTLNTAAQTGSQFFVEFLFTCRKTGWGAVGEMWTTAKSCLGLSAAVQGRMDMIPANGAAVVAALDLTAATTLSLTAQFSVATNPTNLIIQQALIELPN